MSDKEKQIKFISEPENILLLRKSLGLSQSELAEKIECYTPQISSWENGYKPLPTKFIDKLISLYPQKIDSLILELENQKT